MHHFTISYKMTHFMQLANRWIDLFTNSN